MSDEHSHRHDRPTAGGAGGEGRPPAPGDTHRHDHHDGDEHHHPHDHPHDPHHPHDHHDDEERAGAPATPVRPDSGEDAGTVALSEALRSSFVIVRVLLGALVIYFLSSGIFTVTSQQRAIILRFGEPVRHAGQVEVGPGLHWAFPYPIDEVIKMPIAELQTVQSTIGWYAVTPAEEAQNIVPSVGGSLNPAAEGYAITGDGNIIHSRAIIRYRITEPLKFFLNHVQGTVLMTNIVDNAVTYAAARYRVDDALRRDVAGFKEVVLKRVNDLVAAHDLGVTVDPSDIVTIPPRQVKTEFDAVLSAEVDRSKSVSDAQSYSNRVVNEARGQATARVNQGETDRNRMVQGVAAEAQKFTSLLPEYRKNPEFFRDRLQTETLRRILTNAQDKFSLMPMDSRDELRLQFGREPVKPTRQVIP